MKIWDKPPTLDEVVALVASGSHPTIHDSLGLKLTEVGPDYLQGTLPVDGRTHQMAGLLHGGASVVLAESLGSIASYLVAGKGKTCVGIEVSASHLSGMREGIVTGRATAVRLGKSLHVWDILICEGATFGGRLVCKSRLTVMVR